ncbi:MAG: alpha/beta fold hydrolase [Spirochaetes bacterium]|nr:alpha/beta fold hydrolase [Spirochaetota bacterium]
MRCRRAFLVLVLALLPGLRGTAAAIVSRSLVVDGISIHVLDTAPGRVDLPTAILVHGWAGCTTDFEPLLERLGDDRRWVAFDFPGCGESDKPDMHYSISGMAEFVERFREALGVETMDLVGHSLGGQIAAHYAVRYPGRVRRLVLIDPDGMAGEEGCVLGLARLGPLVDLAFDLNSRCLIRSVMRKKVFHGRSGLEDAVDGKAAFLLTPGGNRAVSRITREAVGTEPVDDVLPLLRQDTLVIWGVEDRVLPIRWADGWMRRLSRAEYCPIPECGHMPSAEKPAETAIALEEFLQRP